MRLVSPRTYIRPRSDPFRELVSNCLLLRKSGESDIDDVDTLVKERSRSVGADDLEDQPAHRLHARILRTITPQRRFTIEIRNPHKEAVVDEGFAPEPVV